MQEIRCGHCHKKLGVGEFRRLLIKCPRCKGMNHLRAASSESERRRAPVIGENHGLNANQAAG
jgi:phage FluMu protein Com